MIFSAEVFSLVVSAQDRTEAGSDTVAVDIALAVDTAVDLSTVLAVDMDTAVVAVGTAEGSDTGKGLDTAVAETVVVADTADVAETADVTAVYSVVSEYHNSACTVLLFQAEYKSSLYSDYPYYLIFFCLTYYAPFRKACSLFIQQKAGFYLFQSSDINHNAGNCRTYQIIYYHCRC